MTTIAEATWRAKGVELFGEDMNAWRFQCPTCGEIMSINRAKAEVPAVYHERLRGDATRADGSRRSGWSVEQECIGRHVPGFGCNWCAYGLFSGPLSVQREGSDGSTCAFDFEGRPFTGGPRTKPRDYAGTSALFGDDGERYHGYRYRLGRRWATGKPLGVIALNPSTADDKEDDATVRVLMGLARRLGLPGLDVGNLYAWTATDPRELHARRKARGEAACVGPDNGRHLDEIIRGSARVLVAWGGNPVSHDLVRQVHDLALNAGVQLECIGFNADKAGSPKHPLRNKLPAELFRWAP